MLIGLLHYHRSRVLELEQRPVYGDIESAVALIINQAGSSGLGLQQLVAETGLAWNIVLRAVLFLYTNGDIRCLLEAEDLRLVARQLSRST